MNYENVAKGETTTLLSHLEKLYANAVTISKERIRIEYGEDSLRYVIKNNVINACLEYSEEDGHYIQVSYFKDYYDQWWDNITSCFSYDINDDILYSKKAAEEFVIDCRAKKMAKEILDREKRRQKIKDKENKERALFEELKEKYVCQE